MRRVLILTALLVGAAGSGAAGASGPAPVAPMTPVSSKASGEEIRPRVDHHVRHAEELGAHFDHMLRQECPLFTTTEEWDTWIGGETDQLVSLVAHIEQAWEEAKRTGDDDVRRAAKAPRRRLTEARGLLEKLTTCADRNNAPLQPADIVAKIQRDVPRRQAEIALPQ